MLDPHDPLGEAKTPKSHRRHLASVQTDESPLVVALQRSSGWAATFTYPTGGPQAIEMAKAILLDCAESVPATVTVPTTAITPDNAKQMMGN